jgi:hypothetical protein
LQQLPQLLYLYLTKTKRGTRDSFCIPHSIIGNYKNNKTASSAIDSWAKKPTK